MKLTENQGRIYSIVTLLITVPSIYMDFYIGAYVGFILLGMLFGCEVEE